MEHTTSLRDRLGIAAASWADTYPGLAALLSDAAAALEGTARASATDDVLPQPAAWVRNWTSPQPHCVTSLDYRSTADAMDGVQYLPAYSADQMRAAIAAERERCAAVVKTANAIAEHYERLWYLRGDELEFLRERLDVAEFALQRAGYRRSCDIAACNCGDQWGHGGHAAQRLSEIGDALRNAGFNGGTLLGFVQTLIDGRELHAEAVRGAARYHWLRDAVLHLPDPHKRVWVREFAGPLAYGDTIDGAIDVAIDIDAQGEAK